ncbi:D-alanyl-D-alanine carboxypeptidase family protein [Moraxella sp.]|uniref:M15 family metallopeptidase n=1 Tax=Moraxella sp. TaxID=479 RepID=UPI0026DB1190|nr:M15 family metallopeptidase [Moraxella sp.]MDO4895462.1 M15 family metallopeptidase [Moraxella sp.]
MMNLNNEYRMAKVLLTLSGAIATMSFAQHIQGLAEQNKQTQMSKPTNPLTAPVATYDINTVANLYQNKGLTVAPSGTDALVSAQSFHQADKQSAQQVVNQTNNNDSNSKDCTPNPVAKTVGIYFYKMPEVNAKDLVSVNGFRVHKEAATSLKQMLTDAKSSGVNLTLGSAFRSVAHQQRIINRKIKAGQTNKQIYHMSAPAGYSEHHTGFAVDFSPINAEFAKSASYRWLKANAHKYGWYQTYTPEYSAKSGISEESWHWKYKGSATAVSMLQNDDCL